MSVERNYNETFVARLASAEKQMQQHYRPVISVHKWFARRPGSLFRALALAEFVEGRVDRTYAESHELTGVCLDPFMGGGTPLFEASRMGMSVVGYDTNPMARWIVERELEGLDADEFSAAGERVARGVETELGKLYETDCPRCGETADVKYFMWLRHHRCTCGEEHPLLADTMLVSTGLGRHPCEVHLCPACGSLHEFEAGTRSAACPTCDACFEAGLVPPDSTHFCGCGRSYRIPPQGTVETPVMKLVAIDYSCAKCSTEAGATRHTYKAADKGDQRRLKRADRRAAKTPSEFWPDQLIPKGDETDRLLRWGYLRWLDLFNPRQKLALGVLADAIAKEVDGPVKRALQTAFSDYLRYQNMLCRYDRQALKPTDIFAVHGFPVPRVACEPHALGVRGVGSGGFRHILAKYERAKRWCQAPVETLSENGRKRKVATPTERLAATIVESPNALGTPRSALLTRGSMKTADLEAQSVDLVLTDPPYYANVQYAELMDFCFAWLRKLAPETAYFDVATAKTDQDAVGSASNRGADLAEFTRRLSQVYAAAATALKADAPFIFTYHHNELEAYAPLIVACLDARLVPTRLYGCPSEMRASTHIRGRNASTVDTVFVLRKKAAVGANPAYVTLPVSASVALRVGALQRAGLKPTDADRACLRHSVLAVRAMARLAETWDGSLDVEERLLIALEALQRRTASVRELA
jgi:adenine-specific DNA methylase